MLNRKFISEELDLYISEIRNSFDEISKIRQDELLAFASYLRAQIEDGKSLKIIFICTHNSRRSHFSQVWAQVAAYFYDMDVRCYSGGTEATAFNPRAVDALKRAGFDIRGDDSVINPLYEVEFSEQAMKIEAFSKKYSDPYNPQSAYAAVMTCSDADENCPVVHGADARFALTYRDPKESDDTSLESETYDLRCRQIAIEMFYLMHLSGGRDQEK